MMDYKNLGGSPLKLSTICFGAWAAGGWMWGGNDSNDAISAIRASYDMGVTSIDSAPAYGQGASEEIVGEAIKNIPRDKVQILTKYGLRWDLTKGNFYFKSKDNDGKDIEIYKYAGKESIVEECENSLRRLGTDYIDLYQIHWPDVSTPIMESMEAVTKLITQGKVRYAGVCNYNATQVQEAEKHLSIVSNQVPYSMVNRKIEVETVPFCVKNNISILAYSPLERGLLTGKIKPGHRFADGDHRAALSSYTKENILKWNGFLEKLNPMARDKNVLLSQLVIRWTLEQPGITVALVGARNAKQAAENAKASEVNLSPEELAMIRRYLNEVELMKSP